MCKDFLHKGSCAAGESCDLSHDPKPERVPACLHFLRGKCSNSTCRYTHVHVNPSAPVCRDFASLGYCCKGAKCVERHIHECPDYANTGVCRNKECHLPHVDRAGRIRKQNANRTDTRARSSEDTDLSSDDSNDIGTDDIDSDAIKEDTVDPYEGTASHMISQQQDFVRF